MEFNNLKSDSMKISIDTEKQTLNFLLYPSDNYLKLDEGGVYSLFIVLPDNYFVN